MAPGRIIIAAQAASGLAALALPLLLARYMHVPDFAAYVTLQAAAGVLAVLSGLGMDRAAYRFIPPLAQAGQHGQVLALVGRAAGLRLAMLLGVCAPLFVMISLWSDTLGPGSGPTWPWALALALALNLGELASTALQSVLRPVALALATTLVTFGRLAALLALVVFARSISLSAALALLLVGELILAAACMACVATPSAASPVAPARPGPSTPELLRAGLANYAAYLLGLLWAGSTLRLVVAASAPLQATAAYGFFQTLADRGRLYLPVPFMQRQVEPFWSADFARRRRVRRFSAIAGALGKLQFFLLGGVAVLIMAAGPWLIATVVRPEYAQYHLLMLLIVLQQAVGAYATLLWAAANASRRSELLTQAMLLATALGLPLLAWLAPRGGAEAVVLVTLLPPLLIAAWFMVRGQGELVRAIVRPVPVLQAVWLVLALWLAWALQGRVAAPLLGLLAPLAYAVPAWLLARAGRRPLFARNERLLIARYLHGRRR